MLFRACIVAFVLFPVVLTGLGAAEGDLSSRIEARIKALEDADPEVKVRAAEALRRLGPAAAPAVPALIAALADPEIQFEAAAALGAIGPAAVPALVEALADPDVKMRAAMALGTIGPAVEPMVPALIEMLADPDPDVRKRAAEALGTIGPAAGPAVPALIELLADPAVKWEAAMALGAIGLDAGPAVPALIEMLADPDLVVRFSAAMVLKAIGPAAEAAVPALTEMLADPDPGVRQEAASALGAIGPAAGMAVPALTEALEDPDPEVKARAASALGAIGPAVEPAVPALAEAVVDPDPEVRARAAEALAEMGPDAVPVLAEVLADPDSGVRAWAAEALRRLGPDAGPAVPALIEALVDPDPEVRAGAASALAEMGPAVPALIEMLNDADSDVRGWAAWGLGAIGLDAGPAVPALSKALADADPDVRRRAASALGAIGSAAEPAVPALIEALADPDSGVRREAAAALGAIGPAAIPALTEALADPDPEVRAWAAWALGVIGPAAEPTVPALIEALKDADSDVRVWAAWALGAIATSLHDAGAIGTLGALREVRDALEAHTDPDVREHAAPVRRAVEYFELQWWVSARKDAVDWINAHPYAASIIGAVPIWIAVCFGIFCLSPATILKINDVLRPFEAKLNFKLIEVTVSLRHLLLVGALNYRPRVLDAWVSRHLRKVRENFERKRTVKERSVHVPVPVHLDEETIPELKGQHLRGVFGAGTGRLLIWGEGGSGKTSIACRIARWAMADAPGERLAPHRMLPVLIERELDFEVPEGRDPFTETVRGDLEKLIEARVDDDLLAALLERRRVLVIVDHLSEMTETTRQRVRPDVPGLRIGPLIVTSRLEERLGDLSVRSLKPLRVTGNYLSVFMNAYLQARGVRELFPDSEFFQAAARIAELVGERDVTVLLVKLYLDRLIATKERSGDIGREMPGSIPSLMLQYLNDVNRAVPKDVRRDERAVHRDAEALAWACLEERFRPAPARIDEAAAPALAAINSAEVEKRLDYLERRLRLIETVEPARDRVRFALDPVAEYLAGLHAVERYRADAEAWRGFLARADAMPDGLESVRGFLLAVRDCCLAREGEVAVPEFVPDELAKRAGLDLEKLWQARLRERIARYTRQLKATDPDDRRLAAEALGRIGPDASEAVPALAGALADSDPNVRQAAAWALEQIGPAAVPAIVALAEIGPAAVPALVEALKIPSIRQAAAQAMAQIGPAAVPALVEARTAADLGVRVGVARALERIGPAAVPALVTALKDADREEVRQQAAWALGRIGPAAGAAAPALVEALAGPNPEVRGSAAEALVEIGPAAVPTLATFADPDPNIRQVAAWALEQIGPAAAPALVTALRDADREEVRQQAASALGRIGPAAVPAFVVALRDAESPFVWQKTISALGRIGPAAVPALVAALADPDPSVRREAAWALRWIGPAAGAAMPTLIETLKDANPDIRRAAASALERIGPAVVPALPKALQGDSTPVRDAADTALTSNRQPSAAPRCSARSRSDS